MTVQDITILTTVASSLIGFFSYVWIKAVRPTLKFVSQHDRVVESIETIKTEITTNGGGSLKDAICTLGETCGRIETGQKIIEQRTHAALHYTATALFETDETGRLIWTNEPFFDLTGQTMSDLEGFDWLTYVHEEDREEFLSEFISCIEMNRKFQREARTSDDRHVRVLGFPYKVNEEEHGGFLISISEIKPNEVKNV
jgi:PAS domain S-box-containing protein